MGGGGWLEIVILMKTQSSNLTLTLDFGPRHTVCQYFQGKKDSTGINEIQSTFRLWSKQDTLVDPVVAAMGLG